MEKACKRFCLGNIHAHVQLLTLPYTTQSKYLPHGIYWRDTAFNRIQWAHAQNISIFPYSPTLPRLSPCPPDSEPAFELVRCSREELGGRGGRLLAGGALSFTSAVR